MIIVRDIGVLAAAVMIAMIAAIGVAANIVVGSAEKPASSAVACVVADVWNGFASA